MLLVTLWDYQHSFVRIYDHKAKAWATSAKSFDLCFNWVFFVNMLLVSPLVSSFAMIHHWYDAFIWKVHRTETQKGL